MSCEHDPYSEQWKTEAWRFSVGSDEDADSEYGLDDGDGWFQIEVRTNGGHADFSAEAVLAFSDGDLFTATDSSSRIDLDKPVLEWAISEDRKVVRFAFRAPAAPDFAYERYNEIGTVLVRGAIRCSE